jgi:hypothetical protein
VVRHDIEKALIEVRNAGITTIIVEQNAVAALKLADKAIILDTGEVASPAPPRRCWTTRSCATTTWPSRPLHIGNSIFAGSCRATVRTRRRFRAVRAGRGGSGEVDDVPVARSASTWRTARAPWPRSLPVQHPCALARGGNSSNSRTFADFAVLQASRHVECPKPLRDLVLLICVHGVVDHQVCTFGKRDKCFVYIAFSVFVVGQVNEALAVTIHAPGKAAARDGWSGTSAQKCRGRGRVCCQPRYRGSACWRTSGRW